MMRLTSSLVMLLLVCAPRVFAAEASPAAERYAELLDQYEQEGGPRAFAKQFLGLAEQHPHDPAAADALLWVVKNVRGKPDTTRALELLAKHHVDSEKLGPACVHIARSRSVAAEKLLRSVSEQNPSKATRAQACYHLALLLNVEAGILDQLEQQPELAPRVLQYYGKDYGQHLSSLTLDKLTEQRELVYQRMLESFPDVELDGGRLGKVAQEALFAIRHLSVGRRAPEIEGEDILGHKFKLSDFRGKVVMLTFWGHW